MKILFLWYPSSSGGAERGFTSYPCHGTGIVKTQLAISRETISYNPSFNKWLVNYPCWILKWPLWAAQKRYWISKWNVKIFVLQQSIWCVDMYFSGWKAKHQETGGRYVWSRRQLMDHLREDIFLGRMLWSWLATSKKKRKINIR